MTTRTRILTLTTGLILGASMAAMTPASADPDRRGGFEGPRHRPEFNHTLPRVTAMGAGPNWFTARQEAVHAWRDKVASRFGFEFSRWSSARDKDVDCRKVADDDPSWDNYGKRGMKKPEMRRHYEPVTQCVVSAIPSKGWRGWFGR